MLQDDEDEDEAKDINECELVLYESESRYYNDGEEQEQNKRYFNLSTRSTNYLPNA